MKDITRLMIRDFNLKKLGVDFMGYRIVNRKDLSFHHLVVAKRYCKELGFGEGYYKWNGAILNQSTAHDYLHIVEREDRDMFDAITSEMIDENIKGYIDQDNLRRINDILCCFEKEHCSDRTKKGKLLIKREYRERRILL